MSSSRALPVRLGSLRRSTRLAGFLLLVCLMRVGTLMACVPHDVAESLAGGAHAVVVIQASDVDPADDPSSGAPAGDCLHCACHFSAVLPEMTVAMPAPMGEDMVVHFPTLLCSTSPDRELRPPIV